MGSGISDISGDATSIKSLFGKRDQNATNDVLNGQVVATGTPGAQTVTDPNQGLTDGQMRNRKLASGVGKTLGSAFNNTDSAPSGGSSPTQINFANSQPAYQPPLPPQPPGQSYSTAKKMPNPFFGY